MTGCAGMFDGGVPCALEDGHDGACSPAGNLPPGPAGGDGDLTPLEVAVLELTRRRPGISVGVIARELDVDLLEVAEAIGILGQSGRLTVTR